MSQEVTTAFVKQFSSNIFHLSQQDGSRLAPVVRKESQKSEASFYDRIGSVTAVLRTSRHADTPQFDTPHSRRRVTLNDYEWADLIDDVDKVRMLIDPASDYVKASMMAMGRAMDDVVISAANGSAYGGVDGGTAVALPAAQHIGAVSGGSLSGLNVEALRVTQRIFDEAEVDEKIPRYFVFSAEQRQNLLSETEVTSADFNTVKALVNGQIDSYMGFKFIRSERLNNSGLYSINTSTGAVTLSTGNGNAARQCFAFAGDGLLLSIGMDMKARISERDDKGYSTQVYAQMSIGATRMEESKVVMVLCAEA